MDARLFVGLVGSALLLMGVAFQTQQRKNHLFAVGNACMFTYAFLGYFQGGPIFFLILQTFIMLATMCMLLQLPEARTMPILATGGILLVSWSLLSFQDYTTAIFVVGLVLIGIGFAVNSGTLKREVTLMIGSAVIAFFSFLMRDWVFFSLNLLFAVLSLRNVVRFLKL